MKLTSVLWKQVTGRMFKNKWKVMTKKKVLEFGIPDELATLDAKIYPANEVVGMESSALPPDVRVLESHQAVPPTGVDHPLWKPRICYICGTGTRLPEGLQQAQVLTKTVVHEGLPAAIDVDALDAVAMDDEPIKRCILQSAVWDGSQELLPRRIDLSQPGHRFNREYGIKRRRQVDLLTRNVLRHLDIRVQPLDNLARRMVLRDVKTSVFLEKDGDLLQFQLEADLAVVGNKALAPFASEADGELPDLYPIRHTVDLIQTNVYERRRVASGAPHGPFVHTLFICHPHPYPLWQPDHVVSKALVTSFSFAAAQARNTFGEDVQEPPTPVAVQCVVTDGRKFLQLAYQLNTLLLDGTEGHKNVAWVAPWTELFQRAELVDGRVHFDGYDPRVFRRLMAMHLNGLQASA